MSVSAFGDKSKIPSEKEVAKVLGAKSKLWDSIRNHIEVKYGSTTPEWKFYSPKYGWSMKLLLKKRNLFFFGPREGFFLIAFIFGEKAVTAIQQSNLPNEIIEEIVNAKKYAEGRGLHIEVKKKKDVENIIKLLEIKINN